MEIQNYRHGSQYERLVPACLVNDAKYHKYIIIIIINRRETDKNPKENNFLQIMLFSCYNTLKCTVLKGHTVLHIVNTKIKVSSRDRYFYIVCINTLIISMCS